MSNRVGKIGWRRNTQRGQGGARVALTCSPQLFSVLHLASPGLLAFFLTFPFLAGESPNLTVHWHRLHFKRLKF